MAVPAKKAASSATNANAKKVAAKKVGKKSMPKKAMRQMYSEPATPTKRQASAAALPPTPRQRRMRGE